MTDELREVTVNGVRFFQADDVERWHRGNVAKAEEWDELTERIEWLHERVDALKFALDNLRETVDLYVSDDVGMPELAHAMDKAYDALYPSNRTASGDSE